MSSNEYLLKMEIRKIAKGSDEATHKLESITQFLFSSYELIPKAASVYISAHATIITWNKLVGPIDTGDERLTPIICPSKRVRTERAEIISQWKRRILTFDRCLVTINPGDRKEVIRSIGSCVIC